MNPNDVIPPEMLSRNAHDDMLLFTAFLSVAPKLAGIAVLIRFIFTGFVSHDVVIGNIPWPEIIGGLSIVTMFVGNLSALTQKNMKRFLAYSGIADCVHHRAVQFKSLEKRISYHR